MTFGIMETGFINNILSKIPCAAQILTVSFFLLFFSDISHFQEQNDLKGLLENLHQNVQAKKRKNVEIMWLAALVSTLQSNVIP